MNWYGLNYSLFYREFHFGVYVLVLDGDGPESMCAGDTDNDRNLGYSTVWSK